MNLACEVVESDFQKRDLSYLFKLLSKFKYLSFHKFTGVKSPNQEFLKFVFFKISRPFFLGG